MIKNTKKKDKDYLVFTLIIQAVLCLIIFIGLFLLRDSKNKYIRIIDKDYFENIDDNYNSVSEYKPDGIKPESEEQVIVSVDSAAVDYSDMNIGQLSADVHASGGKEYLINENTDIPSNVSVNGYVLNRKMTLPLKGTITSEFGERVHPVTGQYSFHTGIDIAAETGSPIYAAFDGEVLVSDYDQWNGNYLKIVHDGDIMTVYCHCDTLHVKEGDIVKAGDIIAEVGSTGSSTGPHLHFEFRINNISYDPQIALNEARDAF